MKKRFWAPGLILLLVVAATVLLCTLAARAFPSLGSGEIFPAKGGGLVCSMEGLIPVGDEYFFTLTAQREALPITLLTARPNSQVRIVGGESDLFSPTAVPQFYSAEIASGWTELPDGTGTVRLAFRGLDASDSLLLYLATSENAERFLTYYGVVFSFGMGITFLMAVYGFSLWRRKKSEGYLRWFSAFAASVFLWSLCSLPPGTPDVNTSVLFSAIYDLSAVLTMVVCFRICDLRPKGLLRCLPTAGGVAALMALFVLSELALPYPGPDIMRFVVYTVGAAALVYTAAGCAPGTRRLLTGYAVSYGLRLVMLSGILSFTHVNFLLLALRYSKIFNLPFAFCCMLYINRRFADKFSEAEALAAQLEQTNRTLDRKVEERTTALVRQQAQRHTFMTNIFHDLRTPLFILKGCTENLRKDPEELPRLLPVMEERLTFVGGLTEDLFLMAKLEDGKVILETERFPLRPLLERVASACRVEGEKKDVSVTLRAQGDAVVWGDELQLEQVFQNLAGNAVYYSPPGGEVLISLSRSAGEVLVSVQDAGRGMAAEELSHIFERYYRVSGTDKHQSTGLGLSIANELTRLHRGRIEVESTPGTGTRFTVSLPALKEEA